MERMDAFKVEKLLLNINKHKEIFLLLFPFLAIVEKMFLESKLT